MYNNYVYDPYGNYTYNEEYNYYDMAGTTGNYSWNYSNIGYHTENGNDVWHYINVDNSYWCEHFGANWYLYCDPYNYHYSAGSYDNYNDPYNWY